MRSALRALHLHQMQIALGETISECPMAFYFVDVGASGISRVPPAQTVMCARPSRKSLRGLMRSIAQTMFFRTSGSGSSSTPRDVAAHRHARFRQRSRSFFTEVADIVGQCRASTDTPVGDLIRPRLRAALRAPANTRPPSPRSASDWRYSSRFADLSAATLDRPFFVRHSADQGIVHRGRVRKRECADCRPPDLHCGVLGC